MKSLKGTQTEKNILTAFSGESQARNRYTFFASKAKKDGFILVNEIFLETANQEKEHAERLWGFLEGGEVEIHGAFPAGITGATELNLQEAAAGEHFEWEQMYPSFAKVADEEGFAEIAAVMRNIAIAEKFHEKRYLELRQRILDKSMFNDKAKVKWRCLNCGCIVEGTSAPGRCPACDHPQSYFARLNVEF